MNWTELMQLIEEHFNAERCLEKIRTIYDTDRWFSYKHNMETADYCAKAMKEAGLTQIEKLPLMADGRTKYGDWRITRAWHAEYGILRVAEEEGNFPEECRILANYRMMPCSLTMYSPSTPDGGIEAYVVDVSGMEMDQNPETLRGKILLTDKPVANLLEFANQVGAVGILSDYIPLIPGIRNSKDEIYDDCLWRGMYGENPGQVFGFHLTPRKGDFLRKMLKESPIKLFADIKSERYDGISYTVSGALNGVENSLPEVFAYGHLYEPGADDNASGSAVLIELMQCFKEMIDSGILPRPKRTIRIALGNEYGGSMGYLSIHADRKRLCGAIMDMVGTEKVDRARLSLNYNPLANWSFADAALSASNRLYKEYKGIEHTHIDVEFNMDTDNVIADPSLEMPTVAMMEAPALGYHSSMDRPDRMEPDILRRNAVIMGAYLYGLADADEDTCNFLKKEIRDQIMQRCLEPNHKYKKMLWEEAYWRAIGTLEKICENASEISTSGKSYAWSEPMPAYASQNGNRIPIRKVMGCMSSSLGPERQATLWEQVGNVELNTMLFWADGKRSLWDIALHTAVEMKKYSDEEIEKEFEIAEAFFTDMVRIGAVKWNV